MKNRARMGRGGAASNDGLNNRHSSTSSRSLATPSKSEVLLVVAEFAKNNRGEVCRAELKRIGTKVCADFRTYFQDADTGEMIPTKKGISLVVGKLPLFVEAVNLTMAKAEELGLLEKEPQR